MSLVMEEEVRHVAGERHQQHEERRAHRWGKEDAYCVIDGQKVPIQRTRLRTHGKRKQRLGSYELFQRSGPLQQGVWDKMMRGLSTRNYGAVVKDFSTANVVDHLPEEHKAGIRRKLQNAYSMADYGDAKRALERLQHELMHLNPSAARSLEEGLEETLTVHKLRVPDQLRRTLSCTNVIESAFSLSRPSAAM